MFDAASAPTRTGRLSALARTTFAAVLGLVFGELLLVALWMPAPWLNRRLSDWFTSLIDSLPSELHITAALIFLVLQILLLALCCFGIGFLAHTKNAPWLLLFCLGFCEAAVCLCLMVDDATVLPSPTPGSLWVELPTDRESYDLTRRYFEGAPETIKLLTQIEKSRPSGDQGFPSEQSEMEAYVRSNSADYLAQTSLFAEVDVWWHQLARFPRVGDRVFPPEPFQPGVGHSVDFRVPLAYSDHKAVVACTKALAGHGDEALDEAGQLYDGAAKLEQGSLSLDRLWTSMNIEETALQTAQFTLTHATVSPAARVRLHETLTNITPASLRARNWVLCDFVCSEVPNLLSKAPYVQETVRIAIKELDLPNRLVPLRLLFLPKATANAVLRNAQRFADLAAVNDTVALNTWYKTLENPEFFPFKNQDGTALVIMIESAIFWNLKLDTFWKTEALRLEVLKQLQAPVPTSTPLPGTPATP